MNAPRNYHEWSTLFAGDQCLICRAVIPKGSGKSEHARAHARANEAFRVGTGTKTNPYCYVLTRPPP